MVLCGRGDTSLTAVSQSFSRWVLKLTGASPKSLIFVGGIIHLDATLLHDPSCLLLMETDIRKNVRECVRSFEKPVWEAL